MTLNEAIEHAKEKAAELRERNCIECAVQHEYYEGECTSCREIMLRGCGQTVVRWLNSGNESHDARE